MASETGTSSHRVRTDGTSSWAAGMWVRAAPDTPGRTCAQRAVSTTTCVYRGVIFGKRRSALSGPVRDGTRSSVRFGIFGRTWVYGGKRRAYIYEQARINRTKGANGVISRPIGRWISDIKIGHPLVFFCEVWKKKNYSFKLNSS